MEARRKEEEDEEKEEEEEEEEGPICLLQLLSLGTRRTKQS